MRVFAVKIVPSKVRLAESVTPLAVSKSTRFALYEEMVSESPKNVPSPSPKVEVACHTGMVPLLIRIVEEAPRVRPLTVSAALA